MLFPPSLFNLAGHLSFKIYYLKKKKKSGVIKIPISGMSPSLKIINKSKNNILSRKPESEYDDECAE